MTRDQLFETSFRSIDAIFGGSELRSQLKQQWQEWKQANAHFF